jgi:hypothetical protein
MSLQCTAIGTSISSHAGPASASIARIGQSKPAICDAAVIDDARIGQPKPAICTACDGRMGNHSATTELDGLEHYRTLGVDKSASREEICKVGAGQPHVPPVTRWSSS